MWSPSVAVSTVLRMVDSPADELSDEDAWLLKLGKTLSYIRRKVRHLTQEELAERMSIGDANTISRWENGKTSLSAHNLSRLWLALDCPPDWLLDPTDSVTELDRRAAKLRRLASEAARQQAQVEARASGAGRRSRRDT